MTSFRSLTPARQRLVKLMQRLNFGLLRNLQINKGQPNLGPALEVVEELKLEGQREPRPEQLLDNFQLKEQVLELLSELDRIDTGTVIEVAIRHGLPCRLLVSRRGDE